VETRSEIYGRAKASNKFVSQSSIIDHEITYDTVYEKSTCFPITLFWKGREGDALINSMNIIISRDFFDNSQSDHSLGLCRSCHIRKDINVETLLQIERYELRLGQVTRMPHVTTVLSLEVRDKRSARQVLLATPTEKRRRGRPRTRWRDYISDFARFRLGVKSAELSEFSKNLWGLLSPQGCCPRDPSERKSGNENEWIRVKRFKLSFTTPVQTLIEPLKFPQL